MGEQTDHITLGGVDPISQAFDSDPFHGHLGDAALPVVVSVVDLLGKAKVSHTHVHVLIQPEAETGFTSVNSRQSGRLLPLFRVSINHCIQWQQTGGERLRLHAVSGSKVSVDEVFAAEVLHSSGNVSHKLYQHLRREVLQDTQKAF